MWHLIILFVITINLVGCGDDNENTNIDDNKSAHQTEDPLGNVFNDGLEPEDQTSSSRPNDHIEPELSPDKNKEIDQIIIENVTHSGRLFLEGTPIQLRAVLQYEDGSEQKITSSVQWNTSSKFITVDNTGRVTVDSPQANIAINATLEEHVSNSVHFSIIANDFNQLKLIVDDQELPQGGVTTYQVFAIYDDDLADLAIDVTELVNITSSSQHLMMLKPGFLQGKSAGLATIKGSLLEIETDPTLMLINQQNIVDVVLTPNVPLVQAINTSSELKAYAVFSENSINDISNVTQWNKNNDNINVDDHANLFAAALGQSILNAYYFSLTSNELDITVVDNPLEEIKIVSLEHATERLQIDNRIQLNVIGTYRDGTQQDVVTDLKWMSSDISIASVDHNGELIAINHGQVEITVKKDNLISKPFLIEITDHVLTEIQIQPGDELTLSIDSSSQLHAFGYYENQQYKNISETVIWQSNNADVAIVDKGKINTLSQGDAIITASSGPITSKEFKLTVNRSTLASLDLINVESISNIPVGSKRSIIAVAHYDDGTKQEVTELVDWLSTNGQIAIATAGIIHANGEGHAQISAELLGTQSNDLDVSVNAVNLSALQLSTPNGNILPFNSQISLQADGFYSDGTTLTHTNDVDWQVNPIGAAAVTQGIVVPLAEGAFSVTASLNGTTSNSVELTVPEASLESIKIKARGASSRVALPNNFTVLFQATGHFSDGSVLDISDSVTWLSDSTKLLLLDNAGIGLEQGRANVIATHNGFSSNRVAVDIIEPFPISLEIDTSNIAMPVGTSKQIQAIGQFVGQGDLEISDEVEWTSTDNNILRVHGGLISAVSEGEATITAQLGQLIATSKVTVNPAQLLEITLKNEAELNTTSLSMGHSLQLTAMGSYDNNTSVDLTKQASWQSDDPAVVTIVQGKLTAVTTGETTISATLDGLSATLDVTVSPLALESLTITPGDLTLPRGGGALLSVIGTYSDQTQQDLTASVSWESSDPAIAEIIDGKIIASAGGSTQISTELDGVRATQNTNVINGDVTRIQIRPADGSASATVKIGESLQLKADTWFSSGERIDIRDYATWISDNEQIATVEYGLVIGHSPGMAVIHLEVGPYVSPEVWIIVE